MQCSPGQGSVNAWAGALRQSPRVGGIRDGLRRDGACTDTEFYLVLDEQRSGGAGETPSCSGAPLVSSDHGGSALLQAPNTYSHQLGADGSNGRLCEPKIEVEPTTSNAKGLRRDSYPGGILSVQLSGNRPQRERPIALVIFSPTGLPMGGPVCSLY